MTGATKLTNIGKLLEDTGWDTLSKRREKHKLITFHKIFHKESPSYLHSMIPLMGNQVHSYNARGQNDLNNIRCRTQQYNISFLPSVIPLWNKLPEEIRMNPNPLVLKSFLNKDMTKTPAYFNCGSRKNQILHTRLRLECSSLNSHLYHRNLIETQNCTCGSVESTKHFLLQCNNYRELRELTIKTIRYPLTLNLLLFGDRSLSDTENEKIFILVHKYIEKSNRFFLDIFIYRNMICTI